MVSSLCKVPSFFRSLGVRNLNHCMKMSQHTASFISETVTPKELRIPVPWGHIAAKAWGSPESKPVLGLHGWQDNSGTFDRLAPLLPRDLYFVAVDLPGHGLSSYLPKGMVYNYMDTLLQLSRIIHYFTWNEFSIIAHSLGAGIGALYGSLYPSKLKKLVCIEGLIPVPALAEKQPVYTQLCIEQLMKLESGEFDMQPYYSPEEAIQRLLASTDYLGRMSDNSARILLLRGSCKVGENSVQFTRDPRLKTKSMLSLTPDQVTAFLSALKVDLLVIVVKNGVFKKLEVQPFIEGLLEICKSNCMKYKYVEVEGSHHVHLDSPEKVAPEICAFFSETQQ